MISTIFSVVAAAVCSPGTTSIIGIRCGGFDQCMPTKRAGCFSAVAIWVIGMPEVFEAMIASSARWSSKLRDDLALEVQLLRDGLEHQLGAGQRRGRGRLRRRPNRPGADAASTRSSAPVAIW